MLILALLVLCLILWLGFYITSFVFFWFDTSTLWTDLTQSYIIKKNNFELVKKYKVFFNTNGSGFNDLTGDKIDDNQNDDNYNCYKNFWNYEDDDCLYYKGLYWFLPPETKIYLWKINSLKKNDVLKYFLTWELSKDVVFSVKNKNSFYKENLSQTWYLDYAFSNKDYNFFVENKNKDWIQFFLVFSWENNFKEISKNKWYQLIKDKKIFWNDFFSSENYIYDMTWFYERPTNPFKLTLMTGSLDWSGTGDDIEINWLRTGNLSYSGQLNFEILTWNTWSLTGWNITGLDLSGYCNNDFECIRTWYNFSTWNYYFRVKTYRNLENSILENVLWTEIKSIKVE